MFISSFILLVLSLFSASSAQDEEIRRWPNGLNRCSINDENLNDCILKAAKQVMPLLIKGNKELGLVSLDPIAMGNFTLGAERGPITLTVDLAAAQLTGQSALNLQSVRYDRENFKMEMEGLHKEIELTGDYKTQGKLFRVPINSKGTLLFTLKNMHATHTVQFKPRKQRGLTFMDLEINFKINHVDNFKMDLYNPSTTRLAGLALNKLLNDNWRAIFAAFTPSMEEVVQRVYTEAFRPMFQNIPYEEILPEHRVDQEYSSSSWLLRVFFLVFLSVCKSYQSYQWPSNVKRCIQNETNLNKCLLDTARAVIPNLAKGNKELGIRPLDPLRIGNMTVFSERPPISVSFRVVNGVLDGVSKVVLQKIRYNKNTSEMIIEGLHKNIRMSGGYDTFGKIFFLNLQSKGNFLFENKNVQAYHLVKLLPARRKGHVDMDLHFEIKSIGKTKMSFKDSTLPPQANEALTKLVNDNWRAVTKAVMPTLEKAIAQIFTEVLSPIFRRFPMSTLFPENI